MVTTSHEEQAGSKQVRIPQQVEWGRPSLKWSKETSRVERQSILETKLQSSLGEPGSIKSELLG